MGVVGGDIKGKNVILPFEPGEHHVIGKKRKYAYRP